MVEAVGGHRWVVVDNGGGCRGGSGGDRLLCMEWW